MCVRHVGVGLVHGTAAHKWVNGKVHNGLDLHGAARDGAVPHGVQVLAGRLLAGAQGMLLHMQGHTHPDMRQLITVHFRPTPR